VKYIQVRDPSKSTQFWEGISKALVAEVGILFDITSLHTDLFDL
jgi:hypothetical protein